jgi:hypothetical protein
MRPFELCEEGSIRSLLFMSAFDNASGIFHRSNFRSTLAWP